MISGETNLRLLNRQQLKDRVPFSDMTLARWEAKGTFPRRCRIGGKIYWAEHEINAWIAAQLDRAAEED